jgi:hypothetical protein
VEHNTITSTNGVTGTSASNLLIVTTCTNAVYKHKLAAPESYAKQSLAFEAQMH